MTNFEFYKDKLLKMANNNRVVAIKDNKILDCAFIECKECGFGMRCSPKRLKWLYEEHVDQPVLTSREWHLLKALETGYIARDKSGELYLHTIKPQKNNVVWLSKINILNLRYIASNIFNFIKWEDTEPYSVEEMLMWEHEGE